MQRQNYPPRRDLGNSPLSSPNHTYLMKTKGLLSKKLDPKACAKADAAGWAFVLAATMYPPEPRSGTLPDVPKGPMPNAKTRSSTADSLFEGTLHLVVEDSVAFLAYFAIA